MRVIIIHVGFCATSAVAVFHLTRESHQCLDDTIIILLKHLVDDALEIGCCPTRVAHHHRLCLPTNLIDGMLHEVVHNHGCLAQHDVGVLIQFAINEGQRLSFLIELSSLLLIGSRLDEFKHGLIRLIVLQYIKDEFLVDGLFHAVEVVFLMVLVTIEHKGFILWRSSEGEVTHVLHGATHNLLISHQRVHLVFKIIGIEVWNVLQILVGAQCIHKVFCTLIANGGMGFIHYDGILAMFFAFQGFKGEGEFLHGGDDDAVTFVESGCQILGASADVLHRAHHVFKVHHVVGHIAVEHNTVGHHDDAVEDGATVQIRHVSQLMSKPSHRLGFA